MLNLMCQTQQANLFHNEFPYFHWSGDVGVCVCVCVCWRHTLSLGRARCQRVRCVRTHTHFLFRSPCSDCDWELFIFHFSSMLRRVPSFETKAKLVSTMCAFKTKDHKWNLKHILVKNHKIRFFSMLFFI